MSPKRVIVSQKRVIVSQKRVIVSQKHAIVSQKRVTVSQKRVIVSQKRVNLSEYKTGMTGETTEQFYAEVDESDFVFSGSLPSTGNIYIRMKPPSLIKLLESLMIFSVSVLNALSLRDGRLILKTT